MSVCRRHTPNPKSRPSAIFFSSLVRNNRKMPTCTGSESVPTLGALLHIRFYKHDHSVPSKSQSALVTLIEASTGSLSSQGGRGGGGRNTGDAGAGTGATGVRMMLTTRDASKLTGSLRKCVKPFKVFAQSVSCSVDSRLLRPQGFIFFHGLDSTRDFSMQSVPRSSASIHTVPRFSFFCLRLLL